MITVIIWAECRVQSAWSRKARGQKNLAAFEGREKIKIIIKSCESKFQIISWSRLRRERAATRNPVEELRYE
jgi:hypothetical protein